MPRRPFPALLAALLLVAGTAFWLGRGEVVYQEGSGEDRVRVVERSDGLRTLYLGTSRGRQTALYPDRPQHLELPYTKVAVAGVGLVPADVEVLFVGLGGGAMPRYLRWLLPRARIQVAELDPRVVEVAREYFAFSTDSLLSVHVGDGRALIEAAPPGRWGLVVLDAFSGGRIPPPLATLEFLEAVERSLVPGGVAVSNLHTTDPDYRRMLATWLEAFPAVVLVDVPARRQKILLARRADPGTPPEASLTRDVLVAGLEGLEPGFDLAGLVAREWEGRPEAEGPPLRDGG